VLCCAVQFCVGGGALQSGLPVGAEPESRNGVGVSPSESTASRQGGDSTARGRAFQLSEVRRKEENDAQSMGVLIRGAFREGSGVKEGDHRYAACAESIRRPGLHCSAAAPNCSPRDLDRGFRPEKSVHIEVTVTRRSMNKIK
jgi:hypothetical protein